jgi:hypothetical protein
VPLIVPSCPPNTIPTGARVNDTGAAQPSTPTVTWQAPVNWTTPSSPYSSCLPGGSAAPCPLRLGVVDPANGFQTCGDQVDCTGYTAQTAGSTVKTTPYTGTTPADGDYECRWGANEMTLATCDAQGPAGEGITTAPSTGVDAPVPLGSDDGCFPHGWGLFNPVSWVEQPVKCALQWAFVPSPSTVTSFQSLGSQLENVIPISYAIDGEHWVTGLTSTSSLDCNPGPTLDIGWGATFQPLDLCAGALHDGLVEYRPELLVALWFSVLVPFGFYLLRTSIPGGSGDS